MNLYRADIRSLTIGMTIFVSFIMALLSGSKVMADNTLHTVSRVDLDRYLGHWVEIARLPNRFQDHCVADVTADYQRLEDGKVQVINRCLTRSGEVDEAKGLARIVDKESNAKLEVSFVSLLGWRLFWGDYWIIDLASDYSHAVIGTPDRKLGWVLARSPAMSKEKWVKIKRILKDSGYHPAEFMTSPLQISDQ